MCAGQPVPNQRLEWKQTKYIYIYRTAYHKHLVDDAFHPYSSATGTATIIFSFNKIHFHCNKHAKRKNYKKKEKIQNEVKGTLYFEWYSILQLSELIVRLIRPLWRSGRTFLSPQQESLQICIVWCAMHTLDIHSYIAWTRTCIALGWWASHAETIKPFPIRNDERVEHIDYYMVRPV